MRTPEQWELEIKALDELLRPIAQRPVHITRPGWAEQLLVKPHALDEAGLRVEVETLLKQMIAEYGQGTEDTRTSFRRMFAQYRSLAWAATLTESWTSARGFREHLILFAIRDQGQDSRDAILALQQMCREALAAGVDTAPILREVADLSSDIDKYRMGSTRNMLLRQCAPT